MSHSLLDDETISGFHSNGFASLPRLVDDIHLGEIREVYDRLLSGELDTTGSRDDYLGDLTRQLVGPEHCHELFRDNAALDAGRAIASQLFDWEPVFLYSQLLYQTAGSSPCDAVAPGRGLHDHALRACGHCHPSGYGPVLDGAG